jgi:hypothetical protein
MSGFERNYPGAFVLTRTKAAKWCQMPVGWSRGGGEVHDSSSVFEAVRRLAGAAGLSVEDHPGTSAAVIVRGGSCLPMGCTAELFEALRPGGEGYHWGRCEREPRGGW